MLRECEYSFLRFLLRCIKSEVMVRHVVAATQRARRTPGRMEAVRPRRFRLQPGSHKYNLQSSIPGLRCRRGNQKNAAGCELTVWFLDGHGVSDAAWLYCNSTSFNFSYRNTDRHGNCPRAILIAYNESHAVAWLQDTIGHARTRLGGWLPRNGPVRHPAAADRPGRCIQQDAAFSSAAQFCGKDNDLFCDLRSVRPLLRGDANVRVRGNLTQVGGNLPIRRDGLRDFETNDSRFCPNLNGIGCD